MVVTSRLMKDGNMGPGKEQRLRRSGTMFPGVPVQRNRVFCRNARAADSDAGADAGDAVGQKQQQRGWVGGGISTPGGGPAASAAAIAIACIGL